MKKNRKSFNNQPIGVFDSGIGGISVLNPLVRQMPRESFVYYSDNANCPYGPKSKQFVIKRCMEICKFLQEQNCKIIVIACNTATSTAISHLRKNFDNSFIGIEPATKPAAKNSKTKSIGILATKGTFESELYQQTSKKYTKDVELCIQIGEGLVPLVEAGKHNSKAAKALIDTYLEPMFKADVDHIVLGCTHYPFLEKLILKAIGKRNIKLVNPAPAIARHCKKQLEESGNLTRKLKPKYTFYASNQEKNIRQFFIPPNRKYELVFEELGG